MKVSQVVTPHHTSPYTIATGSLRSECFARSKSVLKDTVDSWEVTGGTTKRKGRESL